MMLPQMKFWGAATVGSKGQVVIPAEAREELNIKEGDKLVVMGPPTKNGVMFIKAESIETMMEHVQQDLMNMRQSVESSEKDAS
jgi:AbrB family looped-hinge helix DNA binding protein